MGLRLQRHMSDDNDDDNDDRAHRTCEPTTPGILVVVMTGFHEQY